jgi:RNA polymerase sigma-70 factor (ECF subfamily)
MTLAPKIASFSSAPRDGSPDDALMAEVALGSEAALETLVLRHRERVVRFGRRALGDAGRAEDLAQETFLRVFRHAAEYQGRGQFTAWLLTIAARLCHNARRSERRRPELPLEAAERRAAPGSPLRAVEARDLNAALEGLPERQRLALLLKAVEGLTYREIARALDCSEQDVANAVFRARRALSSRLGR